MVEEKVAGTKVEGMARGQEMAMVEDMGGKNPIVESPAVVKTRAMAERTKTVARRAAGKRRLMVKRKTTVVNKGVVERMTIVERVAVVERTTKRTTNAERMGAESLSHERGLRH